jgi:hypothetical protein
LSRNPLGAIKHNADLAGAAVIGGNSSGEFRVELPSKPDRLTLNANP